MTNQHVRTLLCQYYGGNRTEELAKEFIKAREHFNNDDKEEISCESEDLQDAPTNEEVWKNMAEWMERRAKNQ